MREAAAKAKTADILRAHEECLAAIKKVLEDRNIPWDSLNLGSPFAASTSPLALSIHPPQPAPRHFPLNSHAADPKKNLNQQVTQRQQSRPGVNEQRATSGKGNATTTMLLGPGAGGEEFVLEVASSGASSSPRDSPPSTYDNYQEGGRTVLDPRQQRRGQLSPSPANFLDEGSR